MLQQNYAFEVTEGMPSHTVVGKVEASDADSLPENRVINYQLRAPQGDNSAGAPGDSTSTMSALHFFTIDRSVTHFSLMTPAISNWFIFDIQLNNDLAVNDFPR